MTNITYCCHVDCYNDTCSRHQSKAPADVNISIADLDDGYCYIPMTVLDKAITIREKLRAAVCRGTQKTAYKCNDSCRALCGNNGDCAYCGIIADEVEAVLNVCL